MPSSVDQHAHPASARGGWGVRMYGTDHPSGSSLNCYSMGDVVCWDDRLDAETAASDYMKLGLYHRCEVEIVKKGQRQPTIAEEREARRIVLERRDAVATVLVLLGDTSKRWHVPEDAREELREFLKSKGLSS